MPSITIVGNIDLFLDIYNFADTPPENPKGGDTYYDKTTSQLKVYDENTSSWITFDTTTSELSQSMVLIQKEDERYNNPRKGYAYIDNNNELYIYDGNIWRKIGTNDISKINLINTGKAYTFENDFVNMLADVNNTFVYEFMLPIDSDIIPYFYIEETDSDGMVYIRNVEIEHKITELNGQKYLHILFEDSNLPDKLQIRYIKSNRIVNKYILVNDLSDVTNSVNTKIDVTFNIEKMTIELQNNNNFDIQNAVFEIPLTQTEYDVLFQSPFALYDENGLRVPYVYDSNRSVLKIKIQSILTANENMILSIINEDYTQEVDIFYKTNDILSPNEVKFESLKYTKIIFDVSWIPTADDAIIDIQINGYTVLHQSYNVWNDRYNATYTVIIDENGDVWYGTTKISSNVDYVSMTITTSHVDKLIKGYLYEKNYSNVNSELKIETKSDPITFDGCYMMKSYDGTYLQIIDDTNTVIKEFDVNTINIFNLTGNYCIYKDSFDKFSLWKIPTDIYNDFS
jgi:hypothetical protein